MIQKKKKLVRCSKNNWEKDIEGKTEDTVNEDIFWNR